jgi:hypothetical protein
MRDTQVENVSQIDTCKEPENDEIDGADCQSTEWPELFRSEEYATQAVERNDEIANDVIHSHFGVPRTAANGHDTKMYKTGPCLTNGGW